MLLRDDTRERQLDEPVEITGLDQSRLMLPRRPLLGCVSSGRRADQCERANAPRCLPNDVQRNVAAHARAEERELLGCVAQETRSHAGDGVVVTGVRDRHGTVCPGHVDDGPVHEWRAQQGRNQDRLHRPIVVATTDIGAAAVHDLCFGSATSRPCVGRVRQQARPDECAPADLLPERGPATPAPGMADRCRRRRSDDTVRPRRSGRCRLRAADRRRGPRGARRRDGPETPAALPRCHCARPQGRAAAGRGWAVADGRVHVPSGGL
ncbi:hypothetical protein GALL_465090 [mine drainage metagenome]|uniref:Uncharacterized protein n=1 Tax=mine drainage metagenome TaxID=410659 RepID=A0A1J5PK32_9ZZZZ